MEVVEYGRTSYQQKCEDALNHTIAGTATPEEHELLQSLVNDIHNIFMHMRRTSLFDVYVYEERITNAVLTPMDILKHENQKLKKEVNGLRKQLGKIEKYKEEV